MTYPIISADSHVTEPPNTYVDHIDPRWRDKAPRLENMGDAGDAFVIDGMTTPVPMGLVAAAGKPAAEIRIAGVRFKVANLMNWRRLLWANDFPHSDSTWPWSQQVLAEHTAELTAEQREAILCRNTAELYQIDLARLS
jgi:hypothetical protein